MNHRSGIAGQLTLAVAALGVVASTALAAQTAAPPQKPAGASPAEVIPLASHRAVYDLGLAQARGKAQIASVRGRILYDFNGNACEGYALQFRQVSELNNGEGTSNLSDLRSTSWEDGDGKSYRFHTENYVNENKADVVDGHAERDSDGRIVVKLTQPQETTLRLETDVLFPTQHIERIIAAARSGQTLLQVPVYDGSEKGDKVYSTLTVIGREIAGDARPPSDAAKDKAGVAGMRRWPVTVSYFERKEGAGEQMPLYSLGFELYENGISRALNLDYNDFALSGEMTALDIKPTKACH